MRISRTRQAALASPLWILVVLLPLGSRADDLIVRSPVVSAPSQRPWADAACGGQNLSPPLAWQAQPKGTTSVAVVLAAKDDTRVERVLWVAYNIAAERGELRESEGQKSGVGITVGINGDRRSEYVGACPSSDGRGRDLVLTVTATDLPVTALPAALDRDALTTALRGHVLATGRATTTIGR